MDTLNIIQTILELIITIGGALFALWIYLHDKRRDKIRLLVKEVIAYYCEEDLLLKKLKEEQNNDKSLKSLKDEMRKAAAQHEKNKYNKEPSMNPSDAKKLLDIL